MVQYNDEQLTKDSFCTSAAADAVVDAIRKTRVVETASVSVKPTTRSPPRPFTTSQLQQEASRRLRLPPAVTMAVAQRLYEGNEAGLLC